MTATMTIQTTTKLYEASRLSPLDAAQIAQEATSEERDAQRAKGKYISCGVHGTVVVAERGQSFGQGGEKVSIRRRGHRLAMQCMNFGAQDINPAMQSGYGYDERPKTRDVHADAIQTKELINHPCVLSVRSNRIKSKIP